MLIEHDGKTIDTEREIRWEHDKEPARYVATLSSGRHVVEYQSHDGTWCDQICKTSDLVLCFENVPVTHVRWFNVHPQLGWPTEEEAKQRLNHDFGFKAVRIEWQS